MFRRRQRERAVLAAAVRRGGAGFRRVGDQRVRAVRLDFRYPPSDRARGYSTKGACRFSGLIPPDRLAKVGRNERANYSQSGRQNKALRLSFVTRHNEPSNHRNVKADDNCPKDAHLIAPVLKQALGIDE